MFRMIEVEKYSCTDKREAEKRETEVMKEMNSSLNSVKSYITEDERKETKQKSDIIKITKSIIRNQVFIVN